MLSRLFLFTCRSLPSMGLCQGSSLSTRSCTLSVLCVTGGFGAPEHFCIVDFRLGFWAPEHFCIVDFRLGFGAPEHFCIVDFRLGFGAPEHFCIVDFRLGFGAPEYFCIVDFRLGFGAPEYFCIVDSRLFPLLVCFLVACSCLPSQAWPFFVVPSSWPQLGMRGLRCQKGNFEVFHLLPAARPLLVGSS